MTVEAIKTAIQELSEPERQSLADWLDELKEQAWDVQMEHDLSPGGRGYHLVERVNADIDNGKFSPFEKGLQRK